MSHFNVHINKNEAANYTLRGFVSGSCSSLERLLAQRVTSRRPVNLESSCKVKHLNQLNSLFYLALLNFNKSELETVSMSQFFCCKANGNNCVIMIRNCESETIIDTFFY